MYAFMLKSDTWLASQAFLVRDEATGAVMRLGRFESQTQMKASQETILEMSKNHQVVRDALVALGPEIGVFSWLGKSNFPSNLMVQDYATNAISVHAPKGTEFGVSEVIYLDTKLSTPDRAVQFNKYLCDALEERLRQVRKSRADSIIAELTHARDSARIAQTSVTKRLQEMELKAGLELSDLRGLTDTLAGGSNSRTQIDQIKTELRTGETQIQQLQNDIDLIQDAIKDPSGFLVTPSELINTQPGLRKLREGYAEAQISASQLSGKFTEQHPLYIAAKTSQYSIRERLTDELQASLTNREQELKLLLGKQERLKAVLSSTEVKLATISGDRAEYANIISEVKTRTTILEAAERELAEASASSDASLSTSLITRLDAPVISDKPIGPGRTIITCLCTIAGLVFGLGIVFVLVPSESGKSFGRRLGDLGFGRRKEDSSGDIANTRMPNPRASDRIATEGSRSDRRARATDVETQPTQRMPGRSWDENKTEENVESRDQIFRELSSAKLPLTDQAMYSCETSDDAGNSENETESGSERRLHPRPVKGAPATPPSFGIRSTPKNV